MCPLRDESGAPAGSNLVVPRGVVRGQTDTRPPCPNDTVCEHVVPPFSLAFLVLSKSSGIPQTFLMTSCADLVYSVFRSFDGSERTGNGQSHGARGWSHPAWAWHDQWEEGRGEGFLPFWGPDGARVGVSGREARDPVLTP